MRNRIKRILVYILKFVNTRGKLIIVKIIKEVLEVI